MSFDFLHDEWGSILGFGTCNEPGCPDPKQKTRKQPDGVYRCGSCALKKALEQQP